MRTETYMVVDPRHDHSFRVPRPDLTAALGSEHARDACSDCHKDRPAEWAARAVKRFYPRGGRTSRTTRRPSTPDARSSRTRSARCSRS